jgi:hypothetical protein
MRGALGAIEKVAIGDDVACAVIGDAPAIGICGSGLIDACAKMLDARVIDSNGLLRRVGSVPLVPSLQKRIADGESGREFVPGVEQGTPAAITTSRLPRRTSASFNWRRARSTPASSCCSTSWASTTISCTSSCCAEASAITSTSKVR